MRQELVGRVLENIYKHPLVERHEESRHEEAPWPPLTLSVLKRPTACTTFSLFSGEISGLNSSLDSAEQCSWVAQVHACERLVKALR